MDSFAAETVLIPPSADLGGPCGVLIPAFNEERTVATVAAAARSASIGPVLVVDDGSTDATAQAARGAGAAVLALSRNLGKGGAIVAGACRLSTEVVVLLDADLTGLTDQHIRDLADPVLNRRADMSRGLFLGGRWRTTAAQRLTPQLNGQRALKRDALLAIPGLASSRYGLEVAITEVARRCHWRTIEIPLVGVSQVMKEEKHGILAGIVARLGMYRDILATLIRRGT